MRAAPGPEPVREPEEVFLVDRVEHLSRRPLHDLVLKGGNRQRTPPAVRLVDMNPPRRQGTVRSPVDTGMQLLKVGLEVALVILPRHPVHARGGSPLQGKELRFEQVGVDVVEQRGEPFLLPFPCSSPYAVQRLCHACPALCPGRALPARIPLGPSPWLHRLRSGSLRLVRPLHGYYDWVRRPAFVHHRLRLLAFTMRTSDCHWSNGGPPRFRRDPFLRDGVFDHGRASASRMTTPHMLPSTLLTASASASLCLSRLNSPPHRFVVYASHPPLPATTQHSLPGARYGLPGPDFHRLDRASFSWRTSNPCFSKRRNGLLRSARNDELTSRADATTVISPQLVQQPDQHLALFRIQRRQRFAGDRERICRGLLDHLSTASGQAHEQ